MTPEQIGRYVLLGNSHIPALNIQVEGVPGYLDDGHGNSVWYGVYFEVPFETGALWLVEQGSEEHARSDKIVVTEYPKWALTETLDYPGVSVQLDSWEDFLGLYEEKKV